MSQVARSAPDVGFRADPSLGMLVAVWSVPAACMVLQMCATAVINGTRMPGVRALVPAVAEWLIWVPVTPVVIRVARRWPVTWPPSATALAANVAGIVSLSLIRAVVYAGATFLLGRVNANVTFGGYYWRVALGWLPIAAVVWGAILAAATALDFARRLRERELRDAELREQLTRAELSALRARLHPHFLFNALHSVGALVRAGQNRAAVDMVAELSGLLRDVLSRDAPEMVRLREELGLVRRYLAIEGVRFADRLRVEWAVDPAADDAVVPSLIVQPLVENAMRHAIAASGTAGRLRIAARRDGDVLAIEVSDDGPGLASAVRSNGNGNGALGANGSAGVGIADARRRLARLYGEFGTLTLSAGALGGATALVRLPFRNGYTADA